MEHIKQNSLIQLKSVALASLLAAGLSICGQQIHGYITNTDMIMIYLVGAVIVAARLGFWPASVYSLAAVSLFNYFFVEPLFSFDVSNSSYWLTFAVMLFASIVISAQAAKLRHQLSLSREREEQTRKIGELKIRNLLLSSIPHDLKTPLSSIIGASDALLQSEEIKSAADKALIATIHRESERFSKVINNILSIARMEEGQLALNKSPYDIAELIGIAINNCHDLLVGHKLVVTVPEDLPFIRADGLLLTQLVQNLLENAARHTAIGTTIEVAASMQDNTVMLKVEDNGGGIAEGQEKEIFSKFSVQARNKAKGVGLGLAICQSIAAAHGGTIMAKNRAGGGACFTFTLPSEATIADEALPI